MQANQRIVELTNKAPEGWKQTLSVAEYNALDGESKRYYAPAYAKYKTKRRREYATCEYGERHFLGWEDYDVAVGDPIGYKYRGYFSVRAINAALNTNVLMTKIMAGCDGRS